MWASLPGAIPVVVELRFEVQEPLGEGGRGSPMRERRSQNEKFVLRVASAFVV